MEQPIIQAIDGFDRAKVICIGDVMLDRFIYGHVERISPEAPIPVIKHEHESMMLGGAGNVVRNIISLGASCAFISVVGNDDTGRTIMGLTGKQERLEPYLLSDSKRISTLKTRYIAGSQQLFRCDQECSDTIDEAIQGDILETFTHELPKHQVVILSDYHKGVLTPKLTQALIRAANKANAPIIIDPKSRDFSLYRGAWLLTPNQKELEATAFDEPLHTEEGIERHARKLMAQHAIRNMLVTRGAKGMILFCEDGNTHVIHTRAREVYDVSGAGDTVIATLGVALASGCDLATCADLANTAAGIVVAKIGTAIVYRTDLKTAVHTQDITTGASKIFPQDIAAAQVESWQREGLKVGFTNGCFDIVHTGHIASINDCKRHCDKLIIAVNSDDSVRRLKGESRPVNSEIDRALLLAELQSVDMVIIFREDTPLALLHRLRPDVLMKGADYQKEQIVGWDFVESYGGRVERIALKEGYSTTGTIKKLQLG
jgi:D-beta-D-heptose 7-phosphate kinase / D-beta-D-heptose 1-phosphate adenosyltransferase